MKNNKLISRFEKYFKGVDKDGSIIMDKKFLRHTNGSQEEAELQVNAILEHAFEQMRDSGMDFDQLNVTCATELDELAAKTRKEVKAALFLVAASATDFVLTHNMETLGDEGRELLDDLRELKLTLLAAGLIEDIA